MIPIWMRMCVIVKSVVTSGNDSNDNALVRKHILQSMWREETTRFN
jgi:hypothetical protein